MFEAIYGLVLIGSGLFVLFSLWNISTDRVSLLMLSVGLIISGIISAMVISESVFLFALVAVLFVYPIVVMILIFLSDGFRCLNNALLGLLIMMLLILLVPQVYAMSVSVMFFLHVIMLRKVYRYYKKIGGLFSGSIILMFLLLSIYPSDVFLWAMNIIVFLESFVSFYALYEEKRNCKGEYRTYEVRRKLTHLLAFIVVVPLPWLDQILITVKYVLSMINPIFLLSLSAENLINFLVIALGMSALPIFLFVEYLRITRDAMLIPSNLLREHEKMNIASYVYSITSALIVALFFPQIILITAVLVGLIADAMAALVGVYYGKHKITKNRTLEGTIAGFLTAFLTTYIIVGHILAALVVSIAIAVFDVLNTREINDNFVFPILSAIVLHILL